MNILELDVFELADRIFEAYPDQTPLQDFGPYRLGDAIGHGGMGEVYLADDQSSGRRVAIKFLRSVWSDAHLRLQFAREDRKSVV